MDNRMRVSGSGPPNEIVIRSELDAMERIYSTLSVLTIDAQQRVVKWVISKINSDRDDGEIKLKESK